MQLIREEDYDKSMTGKVLPYLEIRRTSGTFERVPGETIYYERFLADAPRGLVVLVHGFTECIEKFYETIYYFLNSGFQVWAIQQRGHGKSFRMVSDPSLVLIKDYKNLIRDLHWFVHRVVNKDKNAASLPRILFGHSMGGGVGGFYLEVYPDDFQKAVLSSPMMEINSGSTPAWAAALFARLMKGLAKDSDYLPGAGPFTAIADLAASCTSCRARYENWFRIQCSDTRYQTCAPAIRTAYEFLRLTKAVTNPANTARIKAKVLLLSAGRDNMVSPGGQERFLRQIGSLGRQVFFPDAKHEIYLEKNEVLARYWDAILSFLE